jgi:hypothetical protein
MPLTRLRALAGYARAVGTKGSGFVLRCGNERWYQNFSESLWEGYQRKFNAAAA